jgi:hypothetical protein
LKRNVKVAIRFNFESNDAARESKPLILNPGALWTLSQRYVRAGPAVDVARCDGFNRVCIRRPVTDQSSLSSDASRDCRDNRAVKQTLPVASLPLQCKETQLRQL